MASSAKSNGGGGEEKVKQLATELPKPLKEGERILAPTRRPDGTLRKPVRIRAGYVPQDEVAVYQSKGALLGRRQMKKEMELLREVPPGYDPVIVELKPKSKSAKRNERKKEKHQQQVDVEKGKASEMKEISCTGEANNFVEPPVESVVSQMNGLNISEAPVVTPPPDSSESNTPAHHNQDIDKKIRALKKKIRLTEAQQQKIPCNSEKLSKLEGWREELKLLEYKKIELAVSSC